MATNKYLDLSQYKAPGNYFVEFDASEFTLVDTTTLRLVVGYSRKGYYNRPILLNSRNQAIQIFGDIDTTLESRGSFFHRSLFTALEAGPVLALALLPTNNGQDESKPRDEVDYYSYSVDTIEDNSRVSKALYASFFNKERFWELDTDNFDGIVKLNGSTSGKLFSIANLGNKKVSILSRKTRVNGFDITASEFYGSSEDVPLYLQEFDNINDFFIEVIVLEGDWTNFESLSTDPLYSAYFEKEGLKKAQFNNFLANENVKYIGNFTGSVIPDLIDGNGKNWSIDFIMNQGMSISGLYTSLNREIFENWENKAASDSNLDLVGHNLLNQYISDTLIDDVKFLSYKANFQASTEFDSSVTGVTNLSGAVGNATIDNVTILSRVTTDYGVVNNRVRVVKPTSTAQLAVYNTLKDSAFSKAAIIAGNNNTTSSPSQIYFGIGNAWEVSETDSNGEQVIALYLDVNHTPKDGEETSSLFPFTVVDAALNQILATSYDEEAGLVGQEVYFKAKDGSGGVHAKITGGRTLNTGADTLAITVTFRDGTSTLASLGITASTHDVVISALSPFTTINTGLTWTLRYAAEADVNLIDSTGVDTILAYSGTPIFKAFDKGIVTNGMETSADEFVKIVNTLDTSGVPVKRISFYTNANLSANTQTDCPAVDETYTITFASSDILKTVRIVDNSLSNDNMSVEVTVENLDNIEAGDYVATEIDGVYYAAKILTISKSSSGKRKITASAPIFTHDAGSYDQIYVIRRIEEASSYYSMACLNGFNHGEYHMPGNFLNRQSQLEKIFNVMAPGTNIYNALKDNDNLRFRYIVDTFSGGLTAELYPKNYLSRLAKDKGRSLAILNTPSWKEFKESTDPLFSELPSEVDPRPPIKTEYIKDGGNLSLGPSVRFSLPSEENGAKYAGVFGPYVIVRSNRRNIAVPPAAGISNRFVTKQFDGTKFNAVAGKYGNFSVTGATGALETTFSTEDRANLSEIGWNPIIWKRGAGYVIYDNLMAYQKTNSAFNFLSTRELLMTIEDGIDSILEGYLWDNNDEFLREEVSSRVSAFLSQIRVAGGLLNYKVTMNQDNNTSETITAGYGILDVEVEPAFPIRIFVTKITVHKAGGLSQTGFNV